MKYFTHERRHTLWGFAMSPDSLEEQVAEGIPALDSHRSWRWHQRLHPPETRTTEWLHGSGATGSVITGYQSELDAAGRSPKGQESQVVWWNHKLCDVEGVWEERQGQGRGRSQEAWMLTLRPGGPE